MARAGEALLVDIGDERSKPKVRGRSSFYSLPKTLSEEDDPFGLFQQKTQKEEPVVKTVADTNTGLLVQIETTSPKVSEYSRLVEVSLTSLSLQSHSCRSSVSGSESHLLGVSARDCSGGSARDCSSMFGNLSKVSIATSTVSDEVFLQVGVDC